MNIEHRRVENKLHHNRMTELVLQKQEKNMSVFDSHLQKL